MTRIFVMAALAVSLVACEADPGDQVASGRIASGEAAADSTAPRGVVDSIIPMDVALDRFRTGLSEPTRLRSEVSSVDELIARIFDALEAQDTVAFEELAVNRAEWAWLYYPTNILSQPPYELPPSLAWFQLQETNRKGVLRALRELGGHRLTYQGYSCGTEPTLEGANRTWTACAVTFQMDDADPVTTQLFGSIVERGGRFEVLSYDNVF